MEEEGMSRKEYEEMCEREDRETEQNEKTWYFCNSAEGYEE